MERYQEFYLCQLGGSKFKHHTFDPFLKHSHSRSDKKPCDCGIRWQPAAPHRSGEELFSWWKVGAIIMSNIEMMIMGVSFCLLGTPTAYTQKYV